MATYGQPSTAAGLPAGEADDADWEYEYSTTETETHLITLDLSLPEFVQRRKEHIMHNTRGGFRSWMNPIMNNDSPPPVPSAGQRRDGDNGDNGDENEDENNDDHDAMTDRPGPLTDRPDRHDRPDPLTDRPDPEHKPGDPDDDPLPSEIQILDLHSAQPLFAYRGVVLTGSWTEVIGTELVFAGGEKGGGGGGGGVGDDDDDKDGDGDGNDDGAPALPVAATHPVADDVVLLGAATARIQCTPAELRPRGGGEVSSKDTDVAESKKRRVGFSIPVATNASAQRQKQAAFLEQLMAAKHRLGEQDVVTVQALETPHDAVPAGDAEEAARRARRQVQAARDHRRVLARREREREPRERRERGERGVADLGPDLDADPDPDPDPEPSPARRKRGRTAVDGVAGDQDTGPHKG